MCRIAGVFNTNEKLSLPTLKGMGNTMSYGGPDASGVFIDERQQLGLAHRRLSILDLSEKGNQPFRWNGLVITYNGEVYNFTEVKSKMPEYEFKTGTDTEVILKAYHKWGKDCVKHFRGMFAFAIWEEKTRRLLLCRDRVGVKPLYWYKKDDLFMFASELKAFHQHPQFDKSINQEAVSLFLQQGYIQAPHCIFQYAHKLKPGYWLEIDQTGDIKKDEYWSIKKTYTNQKVDRRSEAAILEELEALLKESFSLRMVADVPVGMFLSGGVDSSTVTALLQHVNPAPVKTFTIGFDHEKRDEAPYAKAVASHLGTDHTEVYCTDQEIISILPRFAEIFDEPFGDSSGIPTYLVSKVARQKVKVSLSADGADELFGGYAKYAAGKNYFRKIDNIPSVFRKGMSSAIKRVNPDWLEKNKHLFPVLRNYDYLSNKFSKLQNSLAANDLHDFFNMASSYLTPTQVATFLPKHFPRYEKNGIKCESNREVSYMGLIDVQSFLEGDIMCKVDRATMQHGLEGREPFLDHHLIEFAMGLPDEMKIKEGQTKHLLRQVLYKYVPKGMIERPKQGFTAPFKDWMMTFLRSEIEAISHDLDFLNCFQLNQSTVAETINAFYGKSKYVNPYVVWFIYTLHQWYYRWMK